MEALHVFLSHAHQDKPFADALVRALRGGGANVWYDEHNLGTGQLLDEITRELRVRPVFVVLLSKDAFASTWVKQECRWAFNLYNREPGRIILPVTVGAIEPADFDAVLYLEDFKRVEAPGFKPYERGEACTRTLRALTLTPAGAVPVPAAPQPAESLDDLLTQGKALMGKQQFAAAIPFFERATRLDAKNSEAWANLGLAYRNALRYDDALAAYDQALAIDGNQAWVWNGKGNALYDLKRYEEALAAYERALALDPTYVNAWNGKGTALRNLQRAEEALAAYERALALDPTFAFAWNNKGFALYGLKRFDEAIVSYDRAISLDSALKIAWSNKALALHALGREDEAREAERRAAALG